MAKKATKHHNQKTDKVVADAQQILDFKAQGLSDDWIRNKLQIAPREYQVRLDHIRNNGTLRNLAISAAQESVLRLVHVRKVAWAQHMKLTQKIVTELPDGNKVEMHPDGKTANAAAGYLKTCVEIDKEIPKLCQQLGFVDEDAAVMTPEAEELKRHHEKMEKLTEQQLLELYQLRINQGS